MIAVRNTAAQSHMVVLLKLEPGKTPADYTRWAIRHEGSPPGGKPHLAHGMIKQIRVL